MKLNLTFLVVLVALIAVVATVVQSLPKPSPLVVVEDGNKPPQVIEDSTVVEREYIYVPIESVPIRKLDINVSTPNDSLEAQKTSLEIERMENEVSQENRKRELEAEEAKLIKIKLELEEFINSDSVYYRDGVKLIPRALYIERATKDYQRMVEEYKVNLLKGV